MSEIEQREIAIEVMVYQEIQKVWDCWTLPEHILQWNTASDDWHTTLSENDLCVGGQFTSHMEAKDGSIGFDFAGIYDLVEPLKKIAYHMSDDRRVTITFIEASEGVRVVESFDSEATNSLEQQKAGWQSILEHFKAHAEKL